MKGVESHPQEETSTLKMFPNLFWLKEMGENLQEWVLGETGDQKTERPMKNPYPSLPVGSPVKTLHPARTS